jgi:Putative prokaryotic signal transducing protein
MRELIRTNDLVLLSFVRAVLNGAGVFLLVADEAMSSVEGSLGILPRRVLVAAEDEVLARRLLQQAGVEAALLVEQKP